MPTTQVDTSAAVGRCEQDPIGTELPHVAAHMPTTQVDTSAAVGRCEQDLIGTELPHVAAHMPTTQVDTSAAVEFSTLVPETLYVTDVLCNVVP